MSAPVIGEVAQDVVDATQPFDLDAEANGYAWRLLIDAIAGILFERIHSLASDTDDRVGYETMLDPTAASAEGNGLEYLAQFTGTKLTDSMSEAEKREAIAVPEGFRRGSLPALRAAIQRTLTGAQTVLIDERYTGDAYQLRVRTLESETASDTATIAAVLTQKPIGVVLTFDSIVGGDWLDYVGDEATWTAGVSDNATWDDVVARLP